MQISLAMEEYLEKAKQHRPFALYGKVSEVIGLIIRVEGLDVFVGEICEVYVKNSQKIAQSHCIISNS